MPSDASRQSPSVSNRSQASSQPSHARQPVSEPGYRKHNLEDILPTAGDVSTKRVKSSAPVYNTPHDLGLGNHGARESSSARTDYELQLGMVEEQNKKWLVMAQQEMETFGTYTTSVAGPGITNETPNFLTQEAARVSQGKPGKAGSSLGATPQALVIENIPQKALSLVRPAPPVSTHGQAEGSTPFETLSPSTNVIVCQSNALDRPNIDHETLAMLDTMTEHAKLGVDRGLDVILTTRQNMQHLGDSLRAAETALPKPQRDLLLKKRYEIETLETKYEDLIAITSDAQKEGLRKLKSESISRSQRDLEDIVGDDPASRKVQATRAQIETLKRDLKRVKDRASSLTMSLMALNGLLEKLP